ncbi:MAG: helix-turn-helix domain-containing protein [Prevotellaceae bacterium]|nr:helix-turn-helix domain-containing protein [Prevotellaceae bacterium]
MTSLRKSMTVNETADLLGVTNWAVYHLLRRKSDRLPATKAGDGWIISLDSVLDFYSARQGAYPKAAKRLRNAVERNMAAAKESAGRSSADSQEESVHSDLTLFPPVSDISPTAEALDDIAASHEALAAEHEALAVKYRRLADIYRPNE